MSGTQAKTGHHRIDLLRKPRSIRVVCTCGWRVENDGTKDKPAFLTPEMHRAMREHLNLRDRESAA